MAKRDQPTHPELKHPNTKRAKQIDNDSPYEQLTQDLEGQGAIESVHHVAHWFRSKDLRIQDNKALNAASNLAKEKNKALLTYYVNCSKELSWHGTSPARSDFILETLRLMQGELKKLNIPLVILDVEERSEKIPTALKFLRDNNVTHVFANYEYEVDELRRDIRFVNEGNGEVYLELHHDQTVVEPGTMTTSGGKPMKVFTPYHQTWCGVVKDDPSLLDTVSTPHPNEDSVAKELKSLFDSEIPSLPTDKQFASAEEKKRIRKLWPPGHEAGIERLNHFIHRKLDSYAQTRSNPAKDSTSRLSPYLASGVISVREALKACQKHNDNSADFSQNGAKPGVYSWVREIVFRELYRQTTQTTPHTSMNLPQNLKFDFVKWEEDEDGWKAWYEGRTGFPFIDAGMRQINHEAYMHNRLRMNVSSFLYCNLLIDYRRGERYFAEHLIDWDLNNNTQGWEPSYTVFNPISQAERNDPDGEYIRKWVPELKSVEGKAVFDPYHRLDEKEFEKLGYPKPIVDWVETKKRCMERFKNDMSGVEP